MVERGYRQLIVMRHAKTEQEGSPDRARQLTSRGRGDARAAGQWLHDNALEPDLVLSSSAARARATLELVCAELASEPVVQVSDDLYGAAPDEVVDLIAEVGGAAQTVLVVGHNPTMEGLAHALQADPGDLWPAHLPTAGLAVLRVPEDWEELADGTAELIHWQVPRG